jgi:hypothetical protein
MRCCGDPEHARQMSLAHRCAIGHRRDAVVGTGIGDNGVQDLGRPFDTGNAASVQTLNCA